MGNLVRDRRTWGWACRVCTRVRRAGRSPRPPQHTIEDNLSQGRDLPAGIIDLNTVGFSLIEAGGATLWLAVAFRPGLVAGTFTGIDAALVGLAILAVALFVEHNIGVRFSRR